MKGELSLPSIPPSRSRDRELWVGIFVIFGVLATLIALFTLTDAALFRGRYVIQTVVSDAGGIRRGDPVQMRGVNIGRVMRFQIVPSGVAISLEILGQFSIPTDSRVELRSAGLLGGMVANVVPGESDQRVRWGDAITGSVERGFFEQTDQLQDQANKALSRVHSLLDEEAIQGLHTGIADLSILLHELRQTTTDQRGEFAALTGSLRRFAQSLEKTVSGPEFDRSLKRIDSLIGNIDSISSTLDQSSRLAEQFLARIEKGEGSLGQFARNEALYNNVSGAAESIRRAAEALTMLADDIRKHPEKYLRMSIF